MYEQLNLQERTLIDYLLNVEKRNFAYISKKLSRSWSTISREIKRNTHDGVYLVNIAENRSKKRKLNKYFSIFSSIKNFQACLLNITTSKSMALKQNFLKLWLTIEKSKQLVGDKSII